MEFKEIGEMIFDIAYTGIIWCIAINMLSSINRRSSNFKLQKSVSLAFTFLAIGDTGHVISRVIAYLNGGTDFSINFSGGNFAVVGFGRITTSITVTLFYFLMLEIWRHRFDKPIDFKYVLLQITGLSRFVLLLFPQNKWGDVVSPHDWSIVRNIPLFVVGLLVIFLFMHSSLKSEKSGKIDNVFLKAAIAIIISFAFYTPVILFVNTIPEIGFLMIPKTLAYLYLALLFRKNLFIKEKKSGFLQR